MTKSPQNNESKASENGKKNESDTIDFDQAAVDMMRAVNEENNRELVDKMQGNLEKLDNLNTKLKDQIKDLNTQKKNLLAAIEELNASKKKK